MSRGGPGRPAVFTQRSVMLFPKLPFTPHGARCMAGTVRMCRGKLPERPTPRFPAFIGDSPQRRDSAIAGSLSRPFPLPEGGGCGSGARSLPLTCWVPRATCPHPPWLCKSHPLTPPQREQGRAHGRASECNACTWGIRRGSENEACRSLCMSDIGQRRTGGLRFQK